MLRAGDYDTLGARYQQERQFSCAAEAFERAVAVEPDSARLHYELGTSLYASGRSTQAGEALERAVVLDPALLEAHLAFGVVLYNQGKALDAVSEWQKAIEIDPGSTTALDWLAKARMTAGQYASAAELLRSAPEDEELLLDLLVADTRAGLFEEAIARAAAAVSHHPRWQRVQLAWATILMQRNRYEEAAVVLEAARAAAPQDAATRLLSLRVFVLKGDTARATTLAHELLKEQPHDFDVLYLNGLLERQAGNYQAAEAHLRAAASLSPNKTDQTANTASMASTDSYDVEYNLGFALARLAHPEQARDVLAKAIALDPSAPEAHFQMASVLRTLGQGDAAQAELALYKREMAERARHDQAIALTTQAGESLARGDMTTALATYRQVIEAAPEDALAYYRLAMALDQAGSYEEENAMLLKAVALRPGFAAADNQLGYIAARAKDDTAAETYFRAAVAAEPQFAEAQSNLGSLLEAQGHHLEAEDHFRAALVANPRLTDAWINLAATLAGESHYGAARDAARRALQIDPRSEDAARLLKELPAGSQ